MTQRCWYHETYLRHGVFNDLLARQVRLIAHKQLIYTLRCISVNLLEPLLYVREGIWNRKLMGKNGSRRGEYTIVGDIVNNNDPVGTTIIWRSDGTEALLSCQVRPCGIRKMRSWGQEIEMVSHLQCPTKVSERLCESVHRHCHRNELEEGSSALWFANHIRFSGCTQTMVILGGSLAERKQELCTILTIWSFTVFPSSSIVRILKSTPMVLM